MSANASVSYVPYVDQRPVVQFDINEKTDILVNFAINYNYCTFKDAFSGVLVLPWFCLLVTNMLTVFLYNNLEI